MLFSSRGRLRVGLVSNIPDLTFDFCEGEGFYRYNISLSCLVGKTFSKMSTEFPLFFKTFFYLLLNFLHITEIGLVMEGNYSM